MRKVLVVEDETILRDTYKLILSTEPYDIHVAADGKEALALCEKHAFDLILLDLMMPAVNGVEFLRLFSPEDHPHTKVVVISNLSSGEMLDEALKLGAHDHVVKSDLSPKQLLSRVRYEVEAI